MTEPKPFEVEVARANIESLFMKMLDMPEWHHIGHIGLGNLKTLIAATQPAIPEGYVLVPREPTEAILDAIEAACDCYLSDDVYRAMIEAAEKGHG
jgi:hypothetical protein